MPLSFGSLLLPILYALLYMTAFVLAIVYWRRSPGACALMLIGSFLTSLATLIPIALRSALLGENPDRQLFGMAMMGCSIFNWLGHLLMIAAAFVGRSQPTALPSRAPRPLPPADDWEKPTVAAPPPDSTGFQEQKP